MLHRALSWLQLFFFKYGNFDYLYLRLPYSFAVVVIVTIIVICCCCCAAAAAASGSSSHTVSGTTVVVTQTEPEPMVVHEPQPGYYVQNNTVEMTPVSNEYGQPVYVQTQNYETQPPAYAYSNY